MGLSGRRGVFTVEEVAQAEKHHFEAGREDWGGLRGESKLVCTLALWVAADSRAERCLAGLTGMP